VERVDRSQTSDAETTHRAGRQDVELYTRTYATMLRGSGPIRLKTLIPAHLNMDSSLHPNGRENTPDLSAFIYSTLRLPECITSVERVLLGQTAEVFTGAGYPDVTTWHSVTAPGRRRWWYFDGERTLAVEIGSTSDVDDIVPTLVAYQIEWRKFHDLLSPDEALVANLTAAAAGEDVPGLAERLRQRLGLDEADWKRLESLWKLKLPGRLLAMATYDKQFILQMLGGTHVGYARAARRWWRPVDDLMKRLDLHGRPVYFVSSNSHSLVNLVSGFATRRQSEIIEKIRETRDPEIWPEYQKLESGRVHGSRENLLYYSARKLLVDARANDSLLLDRADEEEARGIYSVPSKQGLKIDVQVIDLSRLQPEDFDARLRLPGIERLRSSNAVIVNVDYPLGQAAYQVFTQIAQSLDSLRGVYVLGKAATLNGDAGDVLIADVVHDEHSNNTYLFDNCFVSEDISDLLVFGSVLDRQKAVTVRGTFLQNQQHLEFYYRENYTVVEMEAGPYLSALYECLYPSRHPTGESVKFSHLPIEFGFLHYASDTPYTQGKNLGTRRLSYYGMDSAYAASVAILRKVTQHEIA
jgi:hypothetical protein